MPLASVRRSPVAAILASRRARGIVQNTHLPQRVEDERLEVWPEPRRGSALVEVPQGVRGRFDTVPGADLGVDVGDVPGGRAFA